MQNKAAFALQLSQDSLVWWLQITHFSSYTLHCVLSMKTVFGSDNLYHIQYDRVPDAVAVFKCCCSSSANEFLPDLLNQILGLWMCLHYEGVLPRLSLLGFSFPKAGADIRYMHPATQTMTPSLS